MEQAGDELSQAQVKLKVIAEVVVEVEVEVGGYFQTCSAGGWMAGWVWKRKLMLSTKL